MAGDLIVWEQGPVRLLVILFAWSAILAEDWPEWRGRGRRGVWTETGILEQFPPEELKVRWRTPVRAGYSAPSVAAGRVVITDYQEGIERAVCLEEETGAVVWTRQWRADYRGLEYANGPRAAPTIDGDRVYVVGASGILQCLRLATGDPLWSKNFRSDYGASMPAWGFASAPLVDGDRVIAIAAGRPQAKVVAFDKRSGRELWRALSSEESEPGYSQPVLIEARGRRQVIVWHAGAVAALQPETGELLWEHPFRIHMNTPIATPVYAAPYLLVSGFFNGARLLRPDAAAASLVWRGMSNSETASDTLHALMGSPVIDGGYIYGICSYGQLRCLRLETGERVWETQQVTVEKARNASAFLIRHQDRYFAFNDRGELIIARLRPEGYQEISRTKLLKPTSPPGARREAGAVAWSHPAFANRHVIARNDEEVIRVSLER